MTPENEPGPATKGPPSAKHRGKWRTLKRVLTGVIGVQSDEVHEQDESETDLETFIMKAVIVLGLIILLLITVM